MIRETVMNRLITKRVNAVILPMTWLELWKWNHALWRGIPMWCTKKYRLDLIRCFWRGKKSGVNWFRYAPTNCRTGFFFFVIKKIDLSIFGYFFFTHDTLYLDSLIQQLQICNQKNLMWSRDAIKLMSWQTFSRKFRHKMKRFHGLCSGSKVTAQAIKTNFLDFRYETFHLDVEISLSCDVKRWYLPSFVPSKFIKELW